MQNSNGFRLKYMEIQALLTKYFDYSERVKSILSKGTLDCVIYIMSFVIHVHVWIGAILLLNDATGLKEPSEKEQEEFTEYREASYQSQVTISCEF